MTIGGTLPQSETIRNRYGGIILRGGAVTSFLRIDAPQTDSKIQEWQQEGLQVVWLEIPAENADCIQAAVRMGFEFHHCSASLLVMVKPLTPDAYIPSGATHTIGVGGVVLSEDRKILVVLEQRDTLERPHYYKLPGGMLERKEHIATGVVREVIEETGIHTVFKGILSMRHHHKGQFNSSNLYIVCLLQPTNFDISIDTNEIGQALWIDAEAYLALPEIGPYNKSVVAAALSGRILESVKIDNYMNSPDEYEVFSVSAL